MNDPYISIESAFTYEKVISRSVFIVTLIPIDTGEQAIDEIRRIRSRYSDATHNCYAYIASDGMRQSDDGEPQGTAGAPMLEVLRKRGVGRLLAVVTRYFGGIKLGAAGLVGAYGGCSRQCAMQALRVQRHCEYRVRISACIYGYAVRGQVGRAGARLRVRRTRGDNRMLRQRQERRSHM